MAGYYADVLAAADSMVGEERSDGMPSIVSTETTLFTGTDIIFGQEADDDVDTDDTGDTDDGQTRSGPEAGEVRHQGLGGGKQKSTYTVSLSCSTAATSPAESSGQGRASSSWSVHLGVASGYVEAPMERPRGASCDMFQVRSVLGRGSFGTVYKVSEKRTGRPYAMKVLQKEQLFSKDILRYALTERNVQSAVSHPFIVGLACAFQTSRELVLVMQYCPNGNLERLVRSQGGLPEDVSRLYFSEVFLAIEHLHGLGVLYRDLKCENIVLDERGHAMLTDFGLSKENVTGTRSTSTFVGSVAYATPEVLAAQSHGTPVDIYGLGVLLYEMLTGLPPFYALNQKKLFDNIRRAKLELPEFVSDQCKLILRELLERDPELRLGALRTSDIRGHKFLAGVDFESVLRREAIVNPPGRAWQSMIADANALANAKAVQPFQRKFTLRRRRVDGWEFPAPEPRGASCMRIGCLVGRG